MNQAGGYPSEAAARDDYDVVKDLHAAGAVGTYDAAVVTKDYAGKEAWLAIAPLLASLALRPLSP